MRPKTQAIIDQHHAAIARLVEKEIDHWKIRHPGANSLQTQIAECRIAVAAWPPRFKETYNIPSELAHGETT